MAKKNTPIDDVISKFGGAASLAEHFGLTPKAVHIWREKDCIPAKYYNRMLIWAQLEGIDFELNDLVNKRSAKVDG